MSDGIYIGLGMELCIYVCMVVCRNKTIFSHFFST